jgi:hypothetical protein
MFYYLGESDNVHVFFSQPNQKRSIEGSQRSFQRRKLIRHRFLLLRESVSLDSSGFSYFWENAWTNLIPPESDNIHVFFSSPQITKWGVEKIFSAEKK